MTQVVTPPTQAPKAPPVRKRRYMKFRLKQGTHVEPDREAPKLRDGSMPQRRFYADFRTNKYPIVASPLDLVVRCGSEKFERVHDDAKADEGDLLNFQAEDIIDEYEGAGPITGAFSVIESPPHQQAQPSHPQQPAPSQGNQGLEISENPTLEDMTVEELKKEAKGNEINLGNAKTKAEIIAVLNANGIKG